MAATRRQVRYSEQMVVRLTPEQNAQMRQEAAQLGIRPSALLRRLIESYLGMVVEIGRQPEGR